MMLGIEANQVVTLRIMKLIIGGNEAQREAQLMISEKAGRQMRLFDKADDLELLGRGEPHVWSPPSPIMRTWGLAERAEN